MAHRKCNIINRRALQNESVCCFANAYNVRPCLQQGREEIINYEKSFALLDMTVQFPLLAITVGLMIECVLNWHIASLAHWHMNPSLKNKVLNSAKVLEICIP